MNNKISPKLGSTPGGLVRYLFGPGDANEHHGCRIIAAADSLGYVDGTRLDHATADGAAEIYMLGKQLDSHRIALGVAPKRGWVWHCAISLPDGETLSDARWAHVARTAITRMGFDAGQGRAGCRWIAVHHGESAGQDGRPGNDHIHLAVNLVREDGTVASNYRDRVTMSRVCAQLEHELGLSVVEGRAGRGMPGYTRGEHRRAKATGAAPDRVRLARTVRACALAAAGEADFVRALADAGLDPQPRFSKDRAQVVGYSIAAPTSDGSVVRFGGGRLAADLTLPRLRERWPAPGETGRADALAEWGKGGQPPRDRPRLRPEVWGQATDRLGQICDQMEATPHTDAAAWTTAAYGAAGLMAAFAVRLEADAEGPMSAAADTLARSAQSPPGQPRVPTHHRRLADLRGIAVAVRRATRPTRPDPWLGLLRALLRLIDALAAWHRATAQARQAVALTTHRHQLTAHADAQRPSSLARVDFPAGLDLTRRGSGIPSIPPPGRPPTPPGRSPGIGR